MIDNKRIKLLKEFQERIGYKTNKSHLLNHALTHRSFINEFKDKKLIDNERLEFLGDAVLGLVISDYLYKKFDNFDEGRLSKLRSCLVNKDTLLSIAKDINLGKFLLLGKGEILSGGRLQPSNLSSSLEAVFGAVFLDKGFEYTYEFIIRIFEKEILQIEEGNFNKDYKTMLQEYTLKKFKSPPTYTVVSETGPGHRRRFEVVVNIGQDVYGCAKGFSKKEAQQEAAKETLKILGLI